ncbi:MAG: hypothetical protein AAF547_15265 [Actinomycetota bacterium]
MAGTAATGGLPAGLLVRAVGPRPDLWPTAIRAGLSLAPRGWWRRPPFLPLPAEDWLRFRTVTAYGGAPAAAAGRLRPEDVVTWLEWRRDFPS